MYLESTESCRHLLVRMNVLKLHELPKTLGRYMLTLKIQSFNMANPGPHFFRILFSLLSESVLIIGNVFICSHTRAWFPKRTSSCSVISTLLLDNMAAEYYKKWTAFTEPGWSFKSSNDDNSDGIRLSAQCMSDGVSDNSASVNSSCHFLHCTVTVRDTI